MFCHILLQALLVPPHTGNTLAIGGWGTPWLVDRHLQARECCGAAERFTIKTLDWVCVDSASHCGCWFKRQFAAATCKGGAMAACMSLRRFRGAQLGLMHIQEAACCSHNMHGCISTQDSATKLLQPALTFSPVPRQRCSLVGCALVCIIIRACMVFHAAAQRVLDTARRHCWVAEHCHLQQLPSSQGRLQHSCASSQWCSGMRYLPTRHCDHNQSQRDCTHLLAAGVGQQWDRVLHDVLHDGADRIKDRRDCANTCAWLCVAEQVDTGWLHCQDVRRILNLSQPTRDSSINAERRYRDVLARNAMHAAQGHCW